MNFKNWVCGNWLQEFVRNVIDPIFRQKISEIDVFLRSGRSQNILERIILQTACTFEFSDCKEFGKNLLNNLMRREDYENTNP